MGNELRLRLDLATFDEQPFIDSVERCHRAGVSLVSVASLGDTDSNRRRLHALNRECSRDRPRGGRFETYEEYEANLIARPEYSSEGTFVAIEGREWVGMVMLSEWCQPNFLFNEMTGVIASHRRRGIATALKLLSIRFARQPLARISSRFTTRGTLQPSSSTAGSVSSMSVAMNGGPCPSSEGRHTSPAHAHGQGGHLTAVSAPHQ